MHIAHTSLKTLDTYIEGPSKAVVGMYPCPDKNLWSDKLCKLQTSNCRPSENGFISWVGGFVVDLKRRMKS